jgi:hypothetical protein
MCISHLIVHQIANTETNALFIGEQSCDVLLLKLSTLQQYASTPHAIDWKTTIFNWLLVSESTRYLAADPFESG